MNFGHIKDILSQTKQALTRLENEKRRLERKLTEIIAAHTGQNLINSCLRTLFAGDFPVEPGSIFFFGIPRNLEDRKKVMKMAMVTNGTTPDDKGRGIIEETNVTYTRSLDDIIHLKTGDHIEVLLVSWRVPHGIGGYSTQLCCQGVYLLSIRLNRPEARPHLERIDSSDELPEFVHPNIIYPGTNDPERKTLKQIVTFFEEERMSVLS